MYFDAAADLVVNTADQPVVWSRFQLDGQPVLRMGSREQPMLAKRGDDLRIDWGYLYLAADRRRRRHHAAIAPQQAAAPRFDSAGTLPDSDDLSDRHRRAAAPAGAGAMPSISARSARSPFRAT